MPWQLNTNSALFRALSPEQQQALQNQPAPPIGVQQQSADLQGAGLSNQGKAISNTVNAQTAPAQVATANSDAVIAQQKANQAQFLKDVQNNFSTAAKSGTGKKFGGKVPPQYYNEVKSEAGQFGIDSADFDKKFQESFVNPNNIMYDTEDNISTRSNLPLIAQVIKSYQALPDNQVGPTIHDAASKVAQLPIIGKSLAQNMLHQANAHDSMLNANAATIKSVINQQSSGGYPLRNLIELGNMVNFLPASTDNPKQAQDKVGQLNDFLKNKYGLNGIQDLLKMSGGGQ